jgi:hypothetical protein
MTMGYWVHSVMRSVDRADSICIGSRDVFLPFKKPIRCRRPLYCCRARFDLGLPVVNPSG